MWHICMYTSNKKIICYINYNIVNYHIVDIKNDIELENLQRTYFCYKDKSN